MLPSLYPIVAVAGAGARRLLDRQAEAEQTLADQERTMAVQAERERLARDMHDSLAKTVHGIGFAALALSRRIEVDPPGAVEDARKLAADARTAAQEARELLSGLRGRDDAELPLPTAIRSEAARWGERTGTRVGGSLDDVGPLPSLALRELRWILKEALANVERYAHASRVDVHLRRLGARVVLTVADDGVGFEVPDDLDQLAGGSFGLRGMRERAKLAGGDLSVESEPGDGTVISVWVPAGAPARQREGPSPAARRRVLRYGAADGRRRGGIHLAVIRVLLVDDNAIVRRGIASLLADAQGIEVVGEAGDGKQAIELAREVSPDVVCLDVRMPVMDGVAAAGPLSEKAKVLMLSYSEDEQLVTGRDPQRRRRLPRPRPLRAGGPGGAHQGGRGGGDGALARDHARGLRGPAARARDRERERGARDGLAHLARARGAQPARARHVQRRDRRGAVHHQQDGEEPPVADLREDRRALAGRGDRPLARASETAERPRGPRRNWDLWPRVEVESWASRRTRWPNVD